MGYHYSDGTQEKGYTVVTSLMYLEPEAGEFGSLGNADWRIQTRHPAEQFAEVRVFRQAVQQKRGGQCFVSKLKCKLNHNSLFSTKASYSASV